MNLSRLLPSNNISLVDWGHGRAQTKILVNVQQFDVDTSGHGTLLVQWRIASLDNGMTLKSGQTRLEQKGAASRRNPEALAMTMSELAAEFSRELAQSISECAKSSPELRVSKVQQRVMKPAN